MIVLDTHTWLMWIIHGEADLPPEVAAALQKESRIGVSAISSFEVAHLLKRRRIELPLPLNDWLREALEPSGIDSLPVTSEIAANSVNRWNTTRIRQTGLSSLRRSHTMPNLRVLTLRFACIRSWGTDSSALEILSSSQA